MDSLVADKYRIVRLLGQGGMGEVYEAENTVTRRRVALKLMTASVAASGDGSPRARERFAREARALGQIRSEHVVEVLDAGVDSASGRPFLAMEYLVGRDLGNFLRGPVVGAAETGTLRQFPSRSSARPALDETLALKIVAQAARGIVAAHDVGILHRDIKPANLFLTARAAEVRLKVVDFGIARVFDEGATPAEGDLTRSGGMLGSPGYMAPEQVRGERELGPAVDVWALGVVLYELLAGHLPHALSGRGPGAQLVATCTEPAPLLSRVAPHVRAETSHLVHAALNLDAKGRTPTARAFLSALLALLPGGDTTLPVDLFEAVPLADAPAAAVPAPATLVGGDAAATARDGELSRNDSPSLSACIEDGELLAWEDGRLPAEAQARLRRHAETCEPCRSLIAATLPTSARGAEESSSRERYRIGELIGAGAMGSVYRAYDEQLHREVALKLLLPEWEGEQTARERLLREARAMARLRHPQIVQVFDAGVRSDGRVFIAMEYVNGPTLRAFLKSRSLPPEVRLLLLAGAGRALASAHAQGIVHRDFKPDNVFVEDASGEPRLTVGDFGLAKMHALQRNGAEEPAPASLTRGAEVVGTPLYMAPEVLRGEDASAASDQFSFAVTVYECLLQRRPFEGRTLRELSAAMEHGLPPERVSSLPGPVGRALRRALAPTPSQRYPSMEALLAELVPAPAAAATGSGTDSSEAVPPVRPGGRRGAWIAGGVALVALGAAFALGRGKTVSGAPQAAACASMLARADRLWTPAQQEKRRSAFVDAAGPDGRFAFERLDGATKARTSELRGATEDLCKRGLTSGEQHCVEWSLLEAERRLDRDVEWTATQVFMEADAVLALPRVRCLHANVGAWDQSDADSYLAAALRYSRGEALSGDQVSHAREDPTSRRDAGVDTTLPFLSALLLALESEVTDGEPEKGNFDAFSEALEDVYEKALDGISGKAGDKKAADRLVQALHGEPDASTAYGAPSLRLVDASTPAPARLTARTATGPKKEIDKAIVLAGALNLPEAAERARVLQLYFQGTRDEAADVARLLKSESDPYAFAWAEAARIAKVARLGERPTSDAAQACLAGDTFDLACHRIVSALYEETPSAAVSATKWATLSEKYLGTFHPAHGEARLHEAESLMRVGHSREAAAAAERARDVLERSVQQAPDRAFGTGKTVPPGDRLGPLPAPARLPGRILRHIAHLARAYVVLAEATGDRATWIPRARALAGRGDDASTLFTLALADLELGDGAAPEAADALDARRTAPGPAPGVRRKARVAQALAYAAGHPARLARAWAKLVRTARQGEAVDEWIAQALPVATLLSSAERVSLRLTAARRLAAKNGELARTLLDNAETEASDAAKAEIDVLRRKLPASASQPR